MTKLERLLNKMDYTNNPSNGTAEEHNIACKKVAQWVFWLWKSDLLDADKIKAKRAKAGR